DKVLFDADVEANEIWFRQVGDDLVAQLLGSDDQVTISDWYDATSINYQAIDQFELASGETLSADNVQNLVDAMAGFGVTEVTENTVSTNANFDETQNVIAVNWS
ncbi:MAG: calcium-binding protein, partial [Alphaproteobacteria bacterium]|nr:calcium-binding protein [Alphaproteobacteria bacterium]